MLPMCNLRSRGINGYLVTHCRIWRIIPVAANHRSLKGGGLSHMAVVPAKRARLNRARASRDPVIHGRRECTNRFDYWIPALLPPPDVGDRPPPGRAGKTC